jgi:predicted nucleic-acid-binding protein
MIFLDTNIFIRYFTRDDELKAQRCKVVFQQLHDNELQATTSESVIAEIIYILSSKRLYNTSRDIIVEMIDPILSLKGLHISDKDIYREALKIYGKTTVDFEDAVIVAWMRERHIKKLYSYDRHFNSFYDIIRFEP